MGKYNYRQPVFMPFMPFYPMSRMSPTKQPKIQFPDEDMDGNDEIDLLYMTKLYPESCKKIYIYVKKYCDNLENSKSFMYDDIIDKETFARAVEKIYEKMKKEKAFGAQGITLDVGMPRKYYPSLFKDLIATVLLYEIFGNRRRRYRRRRRYYPGEFYYFDDYYYPYGGY